jgi:hypothetical protein
MDELWRINCFKCEFETGGFCVAIFYMDVKIIGRSSGRSATGAAAYRSGEKLQSVAHASYQSGEKLQGKSGEITHDYRKKKGVVHSEILLPDNAPEEYKDRQTLWNAVESSEKRKDAQLAREIIVALPREFDLSEDKEVLRKYIQENFVNKGMIADFSIHDKKDGNPHAHIMLTMRNISFDGFGLKNTDWNKKTELLSYRKAWTHIINNTFEQKGMDERIDHRTLKAQGLDRKPTIHMGHTATALERQGIRTERGDYNREITRRNELLKEALLMEMQKLQDLTEELIHIVKSAKIDSETLPNELVTKLKTAKRMNEAQEKNPNTPNKPKYIMSNKDYIENPGVIKRAKRDMKLRKIHLTLDRKHRAAQTVYDEYKQELQRLDFLAEKVAEDIQNIHTLTEQLAQMQAEHKSYRSFLDWKRKRELDKEIEHATGELRAALYYFENDYHIKPSEASDEIARIQEQKQVIETEMKSIYSQIVTLENKLGSIKYARSSEHEYKIKRKTKQQPLPEGRDIERPKQTQTHGIEHRRSVPKVMRELRKEADEATKRRRRRKALAKSKPRQMFVIEPLSQKRLHRDEYYVRKTKPIKHYR